MLPDAVPNTLPHSGCGSDGIAVASDTSGLRFESSHWQKFIELLFTVNWVLKRRKKEKEAGIDPFLKKHPSRPWVKMLPLSGPRCWLCGQRSRHRYDDTSSNPAEVFNFNCPGNFLKVSALPPPRPL